MSRHTEVGRVIACFFCPSSTDGAVAAENGGCGGGVFVIGHVMG